MRPLPEWRSWDDVHGAPDDPETGTTALEMAEQTWDAWRAEVLEEWRGPKLPISDAHHLLDLLFEKSDVAGPDWWSPPMRCFRDKRFRNKSVRELAKLLWFTTAKFSSFASPAVEILEGLEPLLDQDSPVVDAEWYERMRDLLEALAAEQCYTRDATDRRNKSSGGTKKAQQDQARLAPMLQAAKDSAREVWLANGRKWRRGDIALIEKKTSDKLPDRLKSLVDELPGKRLASIRKQIAAEPPPLTETNKGKN